MIALEKKIRRIQRFGHRLGLKALRDPFWRKLQLQPESWAKNYIG